MKFLRSGAKAAAEPYMTLDEEETRDFCSALYDLFSHRIEPYVERQDIDAYIYYGMNAFFVVSVSITAKQMGMEGEPLPQQDGATLVGASGKAEIPVLTVTANKDNVASAVSNPDSSPEEWEERLLSVKKASISFEYGIEAAEEGSAEMFWAVMLDGFMSDARQRGYIDKNVPFIQELVQPGIDFAYTLMTSKPYYESNKNDMPQYYYKIARHCFFAGAYYAYLWDKQSAAYLDDDFHLRLLRAGLPATAAPLMPISQEEVARYCLSLYDHFTGEIAPFASRSDYPVFMANSMHAFYMIGSMIQLKSMRIG